MPKINPRIKSIDDLLGLDAAEESPIEPTPSVSLPTKNTIITLPPQAIRAFRGHPFRLYEGDRLNDLVESISEHGVLNPAIIRKIERDEDGFEYEMLAGHNRQNAAAIANRELPCIVKENLSDEDAWIYVIETNVLQRSFSEMLPSEKAAVLALRYSKMVCQGRRNDIVEELKRLENPDEIGENGTCGSDFHKSKSREALGAEYNLMMSQAISCGTCCFLNTPAAMTGTIRFLHFSNLARPKMPDWNTTAPRGSGNCGRISTGVQTAIGMCPPAMRPR